MIFASLSNFFYEQSVKIARKTGRTTIDNPT